jgi:hypothetical protein
LKVFRKTILIICAVIIGILLLAFVFLNLGPAQRYTTRKVNQILLHSDLPIHIDAIRKILPGSVRIQGITISGPENDTLIYTGELQADIRLLSLLRHKVFLKEVLIDAALVQLASKSTDEKLNIARAFGNGNNERLPPGERPPAKWTIIIREGRLSGIHFQMNDTLGGIHIAEDASAIELADFQISLHERKISLGSVFLLNSVGEVNMAPRLKARKKRPGPPWNLDFRRLDLEDLVFGFSSVADSMDFRTGIGRGSIRANKADLMSRAVDIRKISLEEAALDMHGRQLLHDLLLDAQDLRLDSSQAAIKLSKLALAMDNGFLIEKLSGELDSRSEETQLQLDIRTGNSRLDLKANADENLWVLLSDPGRMTRVTADLEQAGLSLKDLRCFLPALEGWPAYDLMASSAIDLESHLDLEGTSLGISGMTMSQEGNFRIGLEGNIASTFELSGATAELRIALAGLDQEWMEELAAVSGISGPLPDLSNLKLEGNISDSLLAPEIDLEMESPWGKAELIGSLHLGKERFDLAYAMQRIDLGELTNIKELGALTGVGEIKGAGFSGETLQASYYLQLDTLDFKNYPYGGLQLTGTVRPGIFGLQMVARDPCLQGDIQAEMELADTALILQSYGVLKAQLDKLHLYGDTLSVHTGFHVNLVHDGHILETEVHASDIRMSTPQHHAELQELNAFLSTDNISSRLRADGDFFEADLYVLMPIDELDTLGKGYQDYFESYSKASHLTAASRLSSLPEIHGSASVSYHEILDVFLEDSGLYFSDIQVSIQKHSTENSLRTYLTGKQLSYRSLEAERIRTEVIDSAGIIYLDLLADSTSLGAGPENRLKISASASNQSMQAKVYVDDYGERELYLIDVAGRADSTRIVFEVPDQRLILNGSEWQMDDPALLSIDLADNTLLPSLHMQQNSSYLRLDAQRQDEFIRYELDLNDVGLTSLLRNDIIRETPDGSITGTMDYRTDREMEKEISTELLISDIAFSGQAYSDIRIDASLHRGQSESYVIDLDARSDSLEVKLDGSRSQDGVRVLKGQFTRFPLVLLEPLSEKYVSEIGGSLSGTFGLSNERGNDYFTGQLHFHDAQVKVNLLNNVFRIPDQRLEIAERKAVFTDFMILDTLDRPLRINGAIAFPDEAVPLADLQVTSSELQVMSRDMRSRVPFTGNVYVDSRISISGPLTNPSIGGSIVLSRGSEIFYHHMEDLRMTETEKIVNFVSQEPGETEAGPPVLSGQGRLGSSSIETVIEIDPSTMINFTLAKRMFDIFLNVKGGGNIQYSLENDQMTVSGRYEIGEGTTLLKLVGWPDKRFSLTEGGYIRWDGLVENPELGIQAESKVSTSYVNPIDGKNRDIDFFVMLRLTGYLEDLDVLFTVRTPDQYVMSIINTLSPEDQMQQALSVLLFEAIDLPGISSSTNYMAMQVNQILSSQLNQLTQSAITGVDISFGLDTYNQNPQDGGGTPTTSLSYEVKKTFLNNRAQIEFSGRLKDANQAGTTSDHSLNNLSFEYALDSAATKYLKIYNEHTYDDVFEGEVIRTGIGFTYRKRYASLKDIWRRKR